MPLYAAFPSNYRVRFRSSNKSKTLTRLEAQRHFKVQVLEVRIFLLSISSLWVLARDLFYSDLAQYPQNYLLPGTCGRYDTNDERYQLSRAFYAVNSSNAIPCDGEFDGKNEVCDHENGDEMKS